MKYFYVNITVKNVHLKRKRSLKYESCGDYGFEVGLYNDGRNL